MRQFIDIITEAQAYPDRLEDAEEIAEYISGLDPKASPEDIFNYVDDEYRGCGASLKMVPISELEQGHPDGNARIAAKEKRFAKMTTPIPPLVIGDGVVLDGNHRLRVAIAKGETEVPCYVMD